MVLAIGESVRVEELAIDVELRAVEADSRCPSDVVCAWSGDGVVQVAVTPSGAAAQILQLHTHIEPRAAILGEASVELLDLAPYPKSSGRIDARAYRATLRIGRAR